MTVCSATRRDSGLPYGLLRMRGIFDQLHAMGLISGPSIILILIAAVATASAEIITSAALVIVFVLITSPLSGHAIARAACHTRARQPDEGDDDE